MILGTLYRTPHTIIEMVWPVFTETGRQESAYLSIEVVYKYLERKLYAYSPYRAAWLFYQPVS
jgi:hypothetical protein